MADKIFLILLISLTISCRCFAQNKKNTPEQYFEKYAEMAIKEMKRSGVPASITLAQGSLESENGNSDLAKHANNHFGIKCHKEWEGGKYYKDDDEKNECFRVYNKASESYADHSDFLKTRSRYEPLFKLSITDYKGWAYGLKQAGYATNPQYPERLISLIQRYKLYEYDSEDKTLVKVKLAQEKKLAKFSTKKKVAPPVLVDIDSNFIITLPTRQVKLNNKRKYIIAKKTDTFDAIATDFDISKAQLFYFNDLTKDSAIREKEVLYVQSKKRKAEKIYGLHVVQQNETLHEISQLYGIRLKRLEKLNNVNRKDSLGVSTKIILR